MKTISNRLKEFFEEEGIPIAVVEQTLRLSNDSLGKALRNDKKFNAEILPKIIEVYNIDAYWILTGKGQMLKSPAEKKELDNAKTTNENSGLDLLNREIHHLKEKLALLDECNKILQLTISKMEKLEGSLGRQIQLLEDKLKSKV